MLDRLNGARSIVSSRQFWWLCWALGAALFPVGALLVRHDGAPLPFPEHHAWPTLCLWAVAFSAMTAAMWHLTEARLATLVGAQALAGAMILASPAMPSADQYAYLGYGEMLLHGENPWNPSLLSQPDEIEHAFTTIWGNPPPPSSYGPAFVELQALVISVSPTKSTRALIYLDRSLTLLAILGITLLIRGPRIRFWALNPFVLYYFALEGHNDALFLLLVAAALRTRSMVWSGIAVGLGAAIKIPALAAAGIRRSEWFWLSAIGTLACVSLLVPHSTDLSTGLTQQEAAFRNSIGAIVSYGLKKASLSPTVAGRVAYGITAGTVLLALAFIRWKRRDAIAVLATLAALTVPELWPWYFSWALFAAIAGATRQTFRAIVWIASFSAILETDQFFPLDTLRGYIELAFLACVFLALLGTGWLRANIRSLPTWLRSSAGASPLFLRRPSVRPHR